MNWAAPHTDPEATLIGVVDADDHGEADWLRRTVGHFEDATVGFVQCSHAYRDYETSRFCHMANWEYAVFFTTGTVSLDHHGAGLSVGTMSLLPGPDRRCGSTGPSSGGSAYSTGGRHQSKTSI